MTAGADPAGGPPLRVAYLVSQYPALSHTFIEREILGLRAVGVDVQTFSVRPCPPHELASAAMRSEAAATPVLLGPSKAALVRAHLRLLRRRPGAWAAVAVRAARSGRFSFRSRLWQLFYFGEAGYLFELMSRRGLRHVHVHMANVAADVARLTVALGQAIDGPDAGWRWSLTIHGPGEFEMVQQWDVPAKLRSASAVACISDFCRSQLMRLVEPEQWPKLAKVAMSVDTDVFAPPPDRPRAPGEPLRVLFVGRLVPQKGGPVLLDAVARLARAGVRAQTRIIGEGELDAALRAQAQSVGLGETVTFMGAVGQDDILSWYHWADVFVLPSFQEGLPVVLMEAMAAGLPVVTTQIAAISELVADGVSGRVVPAGRADLLADAIAELAADPARRLAMGHVGRAAVQARHTPDTTAPAMARLLRAAQDAPPTRRPDQGARGGL